MASMLHPSKYILLLQVAVLLMIQQLCLCIDLAYTVEEGKNPGTYIGDISVDSHVMDNVNSQDSHLIRFQQLQKGTAVNSHKFQISPKNGKLYTSQVLDAENMCTRGKDCFEILDVAVQKGSSTIKILEIKIIVRDVNDHQPEFPERQINIEFEENDSKGTHKPISNAVDKDIGLENSQITYELKKNENEPFRLMVSKSVAGISKLSLILEDSLDREMKDSYFVQVIAKDGGSPSKKSVLNVHINIIDVNDNPPVFLHNIYNVSIKNEASKTSPIVVLLATDLDVGENGRVKYYLTSQTASITKMHFELNEKNGEVFLVKEFPIEKDLNHYLYVEATDEGRPPLSKMTTVHIRVMNEQNNAPRIDVNFVYSTKENTVDIFENSEIGSFIAYVKIIDNDEGQNGDITCQIDHDKFQLQNLGTKKYEVTLKNPLDREKEEHHDVVISCQDKVSPPLHSNSKFSIQVMDINDVRPQFTKDTFKFFIDENQNSRITLGYINATDPDLGDGGKLTYSLITNNNKHFLPFKITTNGLLSAIMSLDHEFQHTYHFKVFVKDNGTPSLNNTVNVIVEVTDKNDNAPYFTFPSVKPYNLHVTYYPDARNKNITQIKAADSDSQENAFLKYQIIRGNDKQMFTINQYTGFLAFNRQLSQQNAGSYQLDIVVKDSGRPVLSATTTLFLTLTISNNTSQMLNVVQLHTEEKVHLNLVIIITVIAVTIAVFITASLSICIIRCNGQSNVAYAQALDSSNRFVCEEKQLIAPSYPGIWPHPQQPLSINERYQKPPLIQSRTQHNCKRNVMTSTEIPLHAQMQVSIPQDGDSNWKSGTSIYDNRRQDFPATYLTYAGHFNKSDSSGSNLQSRNLLDIDNQKIFNPRPLPPVPHILN